MSIIYEALKKVQGKSDPAAVAPVQAVGKAASANSPLRKSTAVRAVVLLLVFLALGMFLIEILINRSFSARAKKEQALPIAASYTPPDYRPIVFDHPPATFPPLSISPAPAQTNPKEPITSAEQSVAEPQPQLVLNGIVLSEEGNIALINDQILKVGDTVEGARVEEIFGNQVVLSSKAQKITLKAK